MKSLNHFRFCHVLLLLSGLGSISFVSQPSPNAAARVVRRAWGGLTPQERRTPGGGAKHLAEFLFEVAQLTPCRYVVNGLAILETTADLRAGRADISITTSPKGRTVLLLKSPDGNFQVKLDADSIVAIELEDSETTAPGLFRLVDAQGRKHLTVLMLGDDVDARFQIMLGRWTSRVRLKE